MKVNTLCGVCAFALFMVMGAQTSFADPRGLWRAQDGATVHVISCGAGLCGTIASPAPGKPHTDIHNPDPSQRERPVVGAEVIISMMPNGPNKWSGHIYNLDDGQTLPGNLIEVDAATIRVEGCALGICGGQNMSRLR